MGKTRCEACKKSCKGQVVKLQEKHYHTKCFKCKECKKELSPTAFYVRDDHYYCEADYKKQFGVKCKACNKEVEGEVITALGNTYHISCLSCSKCKKNFDAGQNVTFIGNDHLCTQCVALINATKTVGKASDSSAPSSPTPGSPVKTPGSPAKTPDSPAKAPGSPTRSSTLGQPNWTSTPAKGDESIANVVNGGPSLSTSNKTAESDGDVFDDNSRPVAEESVSKTETSLQNSIPNSNSSPLSDNAPKYKSVEDRPLRRGELRFGHHLGPVTYLDKAGEYKKFPTQNVNVGRVEHFHRPVSTGAGPSFSYNTTRNDIATYISSAKQDKSDGKDPVDAAKYPDAYKKERELPIESDYWPGPPLPAAAFPEMFRFRTQPHKSPRRSQEGTNGVSVGEDEEEVERIDPKTQREIDTLSKIRDSGAAQSVLIEIAKKRAQGPTLDPRSASRVPNADHEPTSKTRYESSMFASPSRVLDTRARSHSQDELRESRHRSLPPPSNNTTLPAVKPGYGLNSRSKEYVNDSMPDGDNHVDGRRTPDENELYDPVTGLRRGPRITLKSSSAAPAYLAYKSSLPDILKSSEEPPRIYSYEELKLSNAQLPPDVDRNSLERHLAKDEFEKLFEMSRYDFYQLAEWKQNDMKRRVELY